MLNYCCCCYTCIYYYLMILLEVGYVLEDGVVRCFQHCIAYVYLCSLYMCGVCQKDSEFVLKQLEKIFKFQCKWCYCHLFWRRKPILGFPTPWKPPLTCRQNKASKHIRKHAWTHCKHTYACKTNQCMHYITLVKVTFLMIKHSVVGFNQRWSTRMKMLV